MPRGLTKKRDARLAAILDAAGQLFADKGYEDTTVADTLAAAGIGKGTFYHYFGSKQDVLEAFVERLMDRIVERAESIADAPGTGAQAKMAQLIASINIAQTPEGGVIDELHIPANAQLHHRTLVETVRRVAPVMAQVVEQGIAEGVYATPNPLESVEFLLAGISVVFDEGFFALVPEQMASRAVEVVRVAELVLGARPGSFSFLVAGAGGQP